MVRSYSLTALGTGVAVAKGRVEDPVASFEAGLHAADHLAAVLFAFQFAGGGDDGLDEFTFGGIFEAEVGTARVGVAAAEFFAEFEVEEGIAGEVLEVVEDDGMLFVLSFEVLEELTEARALPEVTTAGGVVVEDVFYGVVVFLSVATTGGLLTAETVAFGGLFFTGDTAVEDGLLHGKG